MTTESLVFLDFRLMLLFYSPFVRLFTGLNLHPVLQGLHGWGLPRCDGGVAVQLRAMTSPTVGSIPYLFTLMPIE